jgi:hypothetical protein
MIPDVGCLSPQHLLFRRSTKSLSLATSSATIASCELAAPELIGEVDSSVFMANFVF